MSIEMECIIHYPNLSAGILIPVTDATKEKIIFAAEQHAIDEQQVRTVSVDKIVTKKHFYHKACYDKFTRILRGKKKHVQTPSPSIQECIPRSTRSSSDVQITPYHSDRPSSKAPMSNMSRLSRRLSYPDDKSIPQFVYPDECAICNKSRIKVGDDIQKPLLLTDASEAKLIADYAGRKEEYQELHHKILCQGDLVGAKFKYHRKCRRELTRPLVVKEEDSPQEVCVEKFMQLTSFLDEHIFNKEESVTMTEALDIYKPSDANDTPEIIRKRRERLKEKLQRRYEEKLLFLKLRPNESEILVSSDMIFSALTLKANTNEKIVDVAKHLHDSIDMHYKNQPNLDWPISIESLMSKQKEPPEDVILFFENLLKIPGKGSLSTSAKRLVSSYSWDMVHGVTRGRVVTPKHFLLGMGLHNMTGQQKVVKIVHSLGGCISSDSVMDIQTGQAQKAQMMSNMKMSLPIKPKEEGSSVLTIFWVDNFDKKIEGQNGSNSINMTVLMAFQEVGNDTAHSPNSLTVKKTKSRQIMPIVSEASESFRYLTKPEPFIKSFSRAQHVKHDFKADVASFYYRYFIWLLSRCSNSYSQIHPTFTGWCLAKRIKITCADSTPVSKTVETYLPPITTKVTDPVTIQKYMIQLQSLAKEVNMDYVNITLDIGAAINAYKVLWSNPNVFGNIVIHPGDFHFLKENFKVIGCLVLNSGFEDIVFQASVSTSGTLNGVLSGSHYNRGWDVHSVISEALERLLFKRFLYDAGQTVNRDLFTAASSNPDFPNTEDERILGADIHGKFDHFVEAVRSGAIGKTAQFWATYIYVVRCQQMAHLSVQENNFGVRIEEWKRFLPFYFFFNMRNYARYGSYYVELMECIDEYYPGLRETLSLKGLSVQAQDRYPLRTPIDQRGEQTINRSAKTSGGISHFASSSSNVHKWCLNRADAAKNITALHDMAGVEQSSSVYKPLRPKQIEKSENSVLKVIDVMENEYVNPFGSNIDVNKLFHLSSGVSVADEIADEILKTVEVGENLAEDFRKNRLLSNMQKFHDPIKQNKYMAFSKIGKKEVKVNKNGKVKSVEVNRNLLSALISFQIKTGKSVDFEKALCYPLSPIPLSISHPDGTRRKTDKSKLKDILFKGIPFTTDIPASKDALVIDLMAVINTLGEIPKTYEELADRFVKSLPRNYDRIDIVADAYRLNSLKGLERASRGESDKIHIASLKSKIPSDFDRVMKNGENKTRLVELILEYIKISKLKVLNLLRCRKLIFSTDKKWVKITVSEVTEESALYSSQEEADTRMMLHCHRILTESPSATVTLRSPSGDTDVVVLAIGMLFPFKDRILLDDGNGTSRRQFFLNEIDIDTDIVDAIIGFHSFTGNDYVSSLFRKGKESCFKILEKKSKHQETFSQLGTSWELSEELKERLEHFVCDLYGSKSKEINKVRNEIFRKKFSVEKKAVDMALLPPCRSVLMFHAERANYIACILKRSLQTHIDEPDLAMHGWYGNGDPIWIEQAFPEHIQDIFFDDDFDENDLLESAEVESEDEDG